MSVGALPVRLSSLLGAPGRGRWRLATRSCRRAPASRRTIGFFVISSARPCCRVCKARRLRLGLICDVGKGHGAVSQHHEARMSAPGSSGTSQRFAFGLSAGRLQCVERTERLSSLATCSGGRLAGAGGTCLRAGKLSADGGGHTNSRIPAGRRRRCNRHHR